MGHLFWVLYSCYLLSTLYLGCIVFVALLVQTGRRWWAPAQDHGA